MSQQLSRLFTLPVESGFIAVDIDPLDWEKRRHVSLVNNGNSIAISSLSQLASLLATTATDVRRLAIEEPELFAFLICSLCDRYKHIFIRESMWEELDQHFGLGKTANQPKIEGWDFVFIAYHCYAPTLRISRLWVDCRSLNVVEKEIVCAPWPPCDDDDHQ